MNAKALTTYVGHASITTTMDVRGSEAEPEIAYFGSKKSARMAVPPTFSVACSVASIHIDAPAATSRSAVSPEGAVNVTLPLEST